MSNKRISNTQHPENFWELTSVWVQAVLDRYEGRDRSDLTQVFARGPFAGWSEGDLYEFAQRLHNTQNQFPLETHQPA